MASVYSFIKRIYTSFNPPQPPASTTSPPLKFGILGAAHIGPNALLLPAKSHAEVLIHAVAARNLDRAKAYAKKWEIAKVYGGPGAYQELLDDPEIDVVYNPLPNSLHYEWTMKALEAGKHVLLEKPSSDSAEDTRKMFELAEKKGLVLLEAFHYRFHPAVQRFKAILDSGEIGAIKSIEVKLHIPKGIIPDGDIRYDFALGGGALMDAGCYAISEIRYLANANPTSVLTAASTTTPSNPDIDRDISATILFSSPSSDAAASAQSSNITATLSARLSNPPKWGFIPKLNEMYVEVTCEGGRASLGNFWLAGWYHYIEVVKKEGSGEKKKEVKRVEKAYAFASAQEGKGEDWWTSYRYQLEGFVDQVRGRKPQTWVTGEDSVENMKVIEMIYEKAGLKARPVSTYVASVPEGTQAGPKKVLV